MGDEARGVGQSQTKKTIGDTNKYKVDMIRLASAKSLLLSCRK